MWLTLEEAIRRLNSPKNVASISRASNVISFTSKRLGRNGENLNLSAPVESESKQESISKDLTVALDVVGGE